MRCLSRAYMPVRVSIDTEHGVVLFLMSGDLTMDEVFDALREMERSSDYRPTFHRYTDARSLTRLPTYEEVRAIAAAVRDSLEGHRGAIRRAYLMAGEAGFGVA